MDKYELKLTDCDPIVVSTRVADMAVAELEGQRRGWGPMKSATINYLLLTLHKAARRDHPTVTPENYDDFTLAIEEYESIGSDAAPLVQEATGEA